MLVKVTYVGKSVVSLLSIPTIHQPSTMGEKQDPTMSTIVQPKAKGGGGKDLRSNVIRTVM